mgnify:CR=1 FL=1
MKREGGAWRVELAAAAQSDYDDILLWTLEHFGEQQVRVYSEVIDDALAALRKGPLSPGVRARDDAAPGLFTLHVARNKHKGRHIIVFRVAHQNVINVLRILHDSMDIERRLPSAG